MKKILSMLAIIGTVTFIASCEKDEGKLPNISFKTGGSYLSADAQVSKGSTFTIGINASKAEDKDVLKKFSISKSVNGGSTSTVFSKDLSGSEGDNYAYDYVAAADTTAGVASKFTFTVTNRDGLVNQVSLTVTTK